MEYICVLDINQARKYRAPNLQGVSCILVQLPAERLLYLNRTALLADRAQNCLPLRGKVPTSGQARYPLCLF